MLDHVLDGKLQDSGPQINKGHSRIIVQHFAGGFWSIPSIHKEAEMALKLYDKFTYE